MSGNPTNRFRELTLTPEGVRQVLALVDHCQVPHPHSHSMPVDHKGKPYRVHVKAGSRHYVVLHAGEFGLEDSAMAEVIDPDSDEEPMAAVLPNKRAHNPMLVPPID